MAGTMSGVMTLEKPDGSPRLRIVMRVPPVAVRRPRVGRLHRERSLCRAHHQTFTGNELGELVRVLHSPTEELAVKAAFEPVPIGGSVFNSADTMLSYHSVAFPGSAE